ncbi:MAG: glycosyltransferase family 4 protein [Candidatus Thermoplasmatota archaeon]|nr:glycosyltransferase family 4 protein [Candidatus Thermoplasmatota archaeon]
MRILYILGEFPKLTSEAFILNEMVELVKRGHEIHIVVDRKGSERAHGDAIEFGLIDRTYCPGKLYSRGMEKLMDFLKKTAIDMMRHPVWTITSLRVMGKYASDPWMVMDIYLSLRAIRGLEIDLIHSPFSSKKNLVKAYLISHVKKRPFTITMRAREVYQSGELRELEGIREIMDRSSRIMTISDHNRLQIEKSYSIRDVPVIRSAIDTEKFRPFPDDKRKMITTVCRFIEKKGVTFLLEAASILIAKGEDDLEFLLVGDGPLKEEYLRIIGERGLDRHFTIKGPMTQEELIGELRTTMIFCLPSVVSRDKDRDMLPNAIKEAMSMEIPVLTTRISGIEELVENGKNGILVEPGEPEELACAILKLVRDPPLRSLLGRNGRQTIISGFSVKKEVDKLEAVFNEARDSTQ